MSAETYRAYTDGACRGNPGPAAIGVSIQDSRGREVATASEAIGHATNNVAEYRAVVRAAELLQDLAAEVVEFHMDSQLVVRQLTGEYRIRDPKMRSLAAEVNRKLSSFRTVVFQHIPREENTRADRLANDALDGLEEMV